MGRNVHPPTLRKWGMRWHTLGVNDFSLSGHWLISHRAQRLGSLVVIRYAAAEGEMRSAASHVVGTYLWVYAVSGVFVRLIAVYVTGLRATARTQTGCPIFLI